MSSVPDLPVPGLAPASDSAAQPEPDAPSGRLMVAVDQLTAHPGNARADLNLTAEFCASVAEAGVRIPLLIARDGDRYRVIEGHRRLAAAVRAGLAMVPCTLDAAREGDDAGQFLDMAEANGESYRRNFTALEEAAALFSAAEAGATRTRIRKTTGRTASDVRAALQAGGLPAGTRDQVAGLGRPVTLADLAVVAEFDGDQDATARILEALGRGVGVEYTAERIRHDRAAAAQHDQLVIELEAAGITVTDDLPVGAARLDSLTHGGVPLTAEAHEQCPGPRSIFPVLESAVPGLVLRQPRRVRP